VIWAGRGARYLAREAIADGVYSVTAPVAIAAGRGADLADRLYRVNRHADQATRMAGEWFHGTGDRANALAQIGIDAQALERDLDSAATTDADRAWLAEVAAPTFSAWKDFLARTAANRVAAYTTEWSVYLSWQARLKSLRDFARARGLVLTSPEPQPLPRTVWERAASGEGSKLDGYLALGKTAIVAAITLTGVVGFYTIVRDLKRPAHV
jgi:hypothetical protein